MRVSLSEFGRTSDGERTRFSLKFQRIVQDEAGDNFISKLHRGKLAIIPWPVIESARFYELFGSLKTCLDKQPVTHKSAGEFLTVLKMLMAKLKVRSQPIIVEYAITVYRHATGVLWIVGLHQPYASWSI